MKGPIEFSNIVGEYLNKTQAFSNPSVYAQIRILYEKIEENKLKSESWFEYDYPNGSPYRKEYHTYDYISKTKVFFQTYNLEWDLICKYEFDWDGEYWVLSPCGDCVVNDISIKSEVKFNDTFYISRDVGYDKDGNIVFGREDLPFIFDRIS
jgi:hypothetical protein